MAQITQVVNAQIGILAPEFMFLATTLFCHSDLSELLSVFSLSLFFFLFFFFLFFLFLFDLVLCKGRGIKC